jgi:hypothetical protein
VRRAVGMEGRVTEGTVLGLVHEYPIILALLLFFLIHMHVYTML